MDKEKYLMALLCSAAAEVHFIFIISRTCIESGAFSSSVEVEDDNLWRFPSIIDHCAYACNFLPSYVFMCSDIVALVEDTSAYIDTCWCLQLHVSVARKMGRGKDLPYCRRHG